MHWLDYRKRLGIDFEDEEKGAFCTALILNKLDDLSESRKERLDFNFIMDFDAVSENEYKLFCSTTGTEYEDILDTWESKIYNVLKVNKLSFKKFLTYYVAFINCLSNRKEGIKQSELLELLDNAFDESRLNYVLLKDNNNYFVSPKGAKELDDALVSQPLEWLNEYPQAKKEWVEALRAYSDATDESASDVADKFRKALERFFQEFFNKTQSLENLKSEYGKYLKTIGVPSEISNNLETLHQAYTNFMNGYAKHHDKTSKKVLEYIMYQTGNIIRLLVTLKEREL